MNSEFPRVGYVVKRYPRYSETFIVNEILNHEKNGLPIEIFSLRPNVDTHFQDIISQVRAPVHYLPHAAIKSADFWSACRAIAREPEEWAMLGSCTKESMVDVYQAMMLAGKVRQSGITHLHAHFATSAATVARMAAGIAGITYSVTMHAKDIYHHSVIEDDLEGKMRSAVAIVTVSQFNRNHLVQNFGYAEKIRVIYNGLDLDQFRFHPNQDRPPRIIAVGRFVPKKGFVDLIEACRLLADDGVAFDCEIVGGGELESVLQTKITEYSLSTQVRLTGLLPQNIVRQKISQSAVMAAPCVIADDGNRDGLPTVITESLALGTPCVSTTVTGIPEIIQDEQTGLLVSPNDPRNLANAIRRLLVDGSLRKKLAAQGRSLVEREFDIQKNVVSLANCFGQSDPFAGNRSATIATGVH